MLLYNTPIITLAKMNGFELGSILARSLKEQRVLLKLARRANVAGSHKDTVFFLEKWKKERKVWGIMKGIQAKRKQNNA